MPGAACCGKKKQNYENNQKNENVKQRVREVATNIAEIKGADLDKVSDSETDKTGHLERIREKLSNVEKILHEKREL